MRILSNLSLASITLLATVAAPITFRPNPDVLLSVGPSLRALAADPLLNVQGSLSVEDEVVEIAAGENRLVDLHAFQGQGGQQVTISLTSPEFDTVLVLTNENADYLGSNDDISEADLNSSLTTTLPETGNYYILVTSALRDGQGAYQLTVMPDAGAAAEPPAATPTETPDATPPETPEATPVE